MSNSLRFRRICRRSTRQAPALDLRYNGSRELLSCSTSPDIFQANVVLQQVYMVLICTHDNIRQLSVLFHAPAHCFCLLPTSRSQTHNRIKVKPPLTLANRRAHDLKRLAPVARSGIGRRVSITAGPWPRNSTRILAIENDTDDN